MIVGVLVVGILAEGVAWWLVERRRGNVWTVVTPTLVVLGIIALLVDAPPLATEISTLVAAGLGVVSGVAFYLATRGFVLAVTGWDAFQRRSVEMYARREPLSRWPAILASAVIAAPGEELFWRGLLQGELERGLDGRVGLATVIAVVLFVAANAPSGNLAIVAAAVVGGALWGILAAWTGGVAAPILCHAVWTALMIAFPVVRRPAEVAT